MRSDRRRGAQQARAARGARAASASVVVGIALRQLRARWGLTAVATGGIALAVLALVTLEALFLGARLQFEDIILGINPDVIVWGKAVGEHDVPLVRRGAVPVALSLTHAAPEGHELRVRFPADVVRSLEAMPMVEAAAPCLGGTALLSKGATTRSVDVRGIEPAAEERVKPLSTFVVAGDWARLDAAPFGIAVGQKLAQEFGVTVGDGLRVVTTAGAPLVVEVVAVFDSHVPAVDGNRIYAPLRTAQVLLARPGAVSRIDVKLRDPGAAQATTAVFERMFGYDAESWQETNANFLAILGVQQTMGWFVMLGVLLLGGFAILAVQIMLVLQKHKDIAILRAVGFRRADILRIFLVHALVMTLVGGVVGDVLGKLAVTGLAHVRVALEGQFRSEHINVADLPVLYVAGLVFAVLVGLLASVFPAWRASRVEPVSVLRGQVG